MGLKISKIDSELTTPETPQKIFKEITVRTDHLEEMCCNPDPRSPHICRTPLNECETSMYASPSLNFEEITTNGNELSNVLETASTSNGFTQKLMNKLKRNHLFDPRSPSTFINRTPILLTPNEDSFELKETDDKSLNLDDTFSNLFINNDVTLNIDEICKESTRIEENNELSNKIDENLEDEKDPRSPTIGVNRTPILFVQDLIEDNNEIPNIPIEVNHESLEIQNKPHNKHLERLKNPEKPKIRKSARIASKMIYNDKVQMSASSFKISSDQNDSTNNKSELIQTPNKRTPLGCVANKSHLRSKSHEILQHKKNHQINDFHMKKVGGLQSSGNNDENNSLISNLKI